MRSAAARDCIPLRAEQAGAVKGKLLSPAVAKVDHEHHTILLNGEKLKYTARRMGVVQKKKTSAMALFLGLTRGPFIAVQPLVADGELVEPERIWSRASSWTFVGEIDRCVAWQDPLKPTRRRKRDAVGQLLRRLMGRPKKVRLVPVVEWTENYRAWPKAEQLPAKDWQTATARFAPPAEEAAKPGKKKKAAA